MSGCQKRKRAKARAEKAKLNDIFIKGVERGGLLSDEEDEGSER